MLAILRARRDTNIRGAGPGYTALVFFALKKDGGDVKLGVNSEEPHSEDSKDETVEPNRGDHMPPPPYTQGGETMPSDTHLRLLISNVDSLTHSL